MFTFYPDSKKVFVNKIFCLGLNYSKHIAEMNHNKPDHPVIFLKANSALSYSNDIINIPQISSNMHYELELVIQINQKAKNIPVNSALDYILGYSAGIDFTLRDIQEDAKKKGLPWSVAKSFDQSAFVSSFHFYNGENLNALNLQLNLNNQCKQSLIPSQMIFSIPEIISYISNLFTLEKGDLIYTGTPQGVGKVNSGDKLDLFINNQLQGSCLIL